ncbi:FAD/NAD(P)-binding domain-containing protein [Clavulina sp. PMI_390]|nr:FAD/NAD(P)-binding domain-containing protein [Clavulina sp. PMI_390]
MLLSALPLALFVSCAIAGASQQPLGHENFDSAEDYWQLPNEIRRVAVIGAGPAGLLFTSTFIKHGFEVRMFERSPNPGGVWHYTDKIPIPAAFPNRPIETMAYIPDVPEHMPASRIYKDGDDGLTVDWRIREHWLPSPTWKNMMSTEPHQFMSLPDIGHPKNTPWKLHQMDLNRHVRQYASSLGLNANDEEHANVTSYWTRVERVEKIPGTEKRWTVTLRKLTPLRDGKLEVNWWQEEFDAVVLGKDSQNDAAWVPPIPGLDEWAHTLPKAIIHSHHYRHPEDFTNKNVLVLGGSFSGLGIANDLIGHARTVTVSTREKSSNPFVRAIHGMFHKNVTFMPEVKGFNPRPLASRETLRDASLVLANGTIVTGFDTIILATGFRKSFPFLVGYHNSTIKGYDEPETEVAPIITDGTHLRSLHWTGHYINDPTLLFCRTIAFRDGAGPHQAIGAARVWAGKARLPSTARMWKIYPGAARLPHELPVLSQMRPRLLATWLNNEILEFGGPLVTPPPVDEMMETMRYYIAKEYTPVVSQLYDADIPANRPRSGWGVWDGREDESDFQLRSLTHRQLSSVYGDEAPEHWADLSLNW